MIRRPTRSTRTDTLFPYTTLFRSKACLCRNVTAIGITREGREKPVSASNLSPATPKLIPMSAFSQLMCALKRIYLNYFSEGPTTMEATSFLLNKERFQRSEEHTSELQSLMRISYAVFCLKKKNKNTQNISIIQNRT